MKQNIKYFYLMETEFERCKTAKEVHNAKLKLVKYQRVYFVLLNHRYAYGLSIEKSTKNAKHQPPERQDRAHMKCSRRISHYTFFWIVFC